jgi:nucleoside triphosphate diphosphatase
MSEAEHPPRPLETPAPIGEPRADALRRLIAIVDRLRDPDGCPWDLKQTLPSVAPHLIEEAHEVVEAVERRADDHVVEEAGDLLMGIVLLSRIAEQEGRFDLARVAAGVSDKLVRRHPHVFGGARADSADAAVANWEAIKRAEREDKGQDASALAGVPVALPALQRASRLADKARAAGFRWTDAGGALEKLAEEVGELEQAFEEAGAGSSPAPEPTDAQRARLEHEIGDVLIAAAFLGNYLRLDPERAAREALRRFERRFRALEAEVGRPLAECSLDVLLAAWRAVKRREDSA